MKNEKRLYFYGVIVSILIIVAILIFLVINKNSNLKLNNVSQVIGQDNKNAELASTSEDKTIEEVKKENFSEIENIEKIEDNTKQTEDTSKKQTNEEQTNKNNQKNNKKTQETTPQNPVFIMPVEGEILRNYAKDKLVYSDTLKEWVTHLGIDIKSPKTSVVKSSESGKITAIKNDPRFGLSVIIEHSNGYSTIYSNLLTAEFITVGEEVKKGETIGTVGNTAAFEILDEPHLHFEILKDGVQVDPNMYL